MKAYTQDEFDALPIEYGIRQCPSGDYSAIREFKGQCSFAARSCFGAGSKFDDRCEFGDFCDFERGCIFGYRCIFGVWCDFKEQCVFDEHCYFGTNCMFGKECSFGPRCDFGWCIFHEGCIFSGHRAKQGYPILSLIGAGFANGTTNAFNTESGPWIEAELFTGDLKAFRDFANREHDEINRTQYLAFADIVAAAWCSEKDEV